MQNSVEGNEAEEYMTISNLQEFMFSNVTEEMNLLAVIIFLQHFALKV